MIWVIVSLVVLPFVVGYLFGFSHDPEFQFVEERHEYDEFLGI